MRKTINIHDVTFDTTSVKHIFNFCQIQTGFFNNFAIKYILDIFDFDLS